MQDTFPHEEYLSMHADMYHNSKTSFLTLIQSKLSSAILISCPITCDMKECIPFKPVVTQRCSSQVLVRVVHDRCFIFLIAYSKRMKNY